MKKSEIVLRVFQVVVIGLMIFLSGNNWLQAFIASFIAFQMGASLGFENLKRSFKGYEKANEKLLNGYRDCLHSRDEYINLLIEQNKRLSDGEAWKNN